ncbi:MAG: S8 family serine peptidase [Rhodobacteraceae bacterium]|nr:S8 family serine peptidase [Paracoccaceae bacterium]
MANWQIDPSPDTIVSGQKTLYLRDAFSQWLLNGGADFRASALIEKQDPQDFNYVVRSKKLTKASRPKPVNLGGGAASNAKFDMISLLPIAASSVPSSAVQVPAHMPADNGLDSEKLVIIGIIDDGVNVFNRRFRPEGQASRIEYAWAQDGPAPQNGATVPFGCEMTGVQITNAMDTGTPERELLRQHGFSNGPNQPYMPDVFANASNHGTQIADLAAGAARDDTSTLNTRLITVQMPAFSVMDTSGAGLVSALHHAAIYVFDRARAMSAHYLTPIPVVLNISFGLTGGARNGQQFLERALRALAIKYRKDMKKTFGKNAVPPVVRVISAGNENILQLHAIATDTGPLDLAMRLQPEDTTASFLEIWLPESSLSAGLTITAPSGMVEAISFNGFDAQNPPDFDAHILADDPSAPVCRVTLDAPMLASGQPDALFWRLVIAFAPTRSWAPNRPAAEAGLWQITTTAQGSTAKLQAWILRDTPVSGFASNGRQAYFDDDYRGSDSYTASVFDWTGDRAVDDLANRASVISRNGAISGLATNSMLRRKNGGTKKGDGPEMDAISVGAYRWDLPRAAIYSGADNIGNEQAPMVMAMAENSRFVANIRASGSYSDTGSSLNGTSAAAPIVARMLAAHLGNLAQADYATFDPKTYLQSLGMAPARPVGMETASGAGIRVERLRDNGVLLPLPAALQANVQRDNRAKI